MQNAYGNYLIQVIIELSTKKERECYFDIILNNIFSLSCHKFSSNVVIKLFQNCNSSDKKKLFKRLMIPEKLMTSTKNKHLRLVISNILRFIPYDLVFSTYDSIKDIPKLRCFADMLQLN